MPTIVPDCLHHDAQLRLLLKAFLSERQDCGLVVDELGLAYGAVRADVAVVGDDLEGFEIKAGKDTLKRMPAQMQAYDQVFDRSWLVTVEPHLAKAMALVPGWWGVLLATSQAPLHVVRPPGVNPLLDSAHIVRLLWREEAVALLELRGLMSKALKKKPKQSLYSVLCQQVPRPEMTSYVCGRLRARDNWRVESAMRPKTLQAGLMCPDVSELQLAVSAA